MVELGPTEFRAGGRRGHGQSRGLPFDSDEWHDISSPYGPRDPIRLPDGSMTGSYHTGVDIPRPAGTIIMAPAPGVVVSQRVNEAFGNEVVLKHDDGSATAYVHLEVGKLMVGKGQRLRRGDILGFVGTTGRSTGNLLHWMYYPTYGNSGVADPLDYIVATLTEPEPELKVPATFAGFEAEVRVLALLVDDLLNHPREYDVALGAIEREVDEMLDAITRAQEAMP